MSVKETNNAFQNLKSKFTEEEIAKVIGKTLRSNFPEPKAAIKKISREIWFVKRLQLGFEVSAADVVQFWSISDRTAQRDISELLECGLVKFSGSKKNGVYLLKHYTAT